MAKDTGFLQILDSNQAEESTASKSDADVLFGDGPENVDQDAEDPDDDFFKDYEYGELDETGDEGMDLIFGREKKTASANEPEEQEEEEAEEEEAEEEEGEEGEGKEEADEEGDKEEETKLPEWTNEIKEIFPDRTFDSMEDYDAALTEHISNLKNTIQEKTQAEEKLVMILNDNPELTSVIQNIAKGHSLRTSLIKAGISPEDFDIDQGDEDAEELIKAKLERQEQSRKRREHEMAVQRNLVESEKAIKSFQESLGIKDSVKERFLGEVHNMFEAVMDGKVSEKMLQNFWKALNYENDIKKAEDRGIVRGRNQKIVVEKKKKAGDGIPKLNGATTKDTSPKKVRDEFTNSLDRGVSGRPMGFLDII